MNTSFKGILMTGALAIAANGLFAAQANTTNAWFEQRHQAKFGRPSPNEEARLKAERANMAFREEFAPDVDRPANTWFNDFYRAKYGRSAPNEEARLNAERVNTAFGEEP